MKALRRNLACAALALSLGGCAGGRTVPSAPVAPAPSAPVSTAPAPPAPGWPSLPERGFIKGRPATPEDVEAGEAVFFSKVGERIVGIPIDIAIPQYGVWVEAQSGERREVLVLQAEIANGMRLVGLRDIANGRSFMGFLVETTLLGTTPPVTAPATAPTKR